MSDESEGSPISQPRHEQRSSRRDFLVATVAAGGGAAGFGMGDAAGAEPVRTGATVNPRLFTFVGGKAGEWSVVAAKAVVGEALPAVERVDIVNGAVPALPEGAKWLLRGVISNERYVTRTEKDLLVKKQAGLGRPEATQGALIPIRKSSKWWGLTQDERRAILEDRSHHIQVGLKYLPAVARRLHHCRDLGDSEAFDFVTLFDYTKGDAAAFDDLVAALRATEEWKFVEREVDIRLVRVKR